MIVRLPQLVAFGRLCLAAFLQVYRDGAGQPMIVRLQRLVAFVRLCWAAVIQGYSDGYKRGVVAARQRLQEQRDRFSEV